MEISENPFPFCRANAIRALAFDCDGVLLDSGRSYYLAYEQVLREAGAHVSPREIYLEEGRPTAAVLRLMLQRHGVVHDDALIRAMVDRRREYQNLIGGRSLFPLALQLLSSLHAAGYKLAMVTGSSRQSVETILTAAIQSCLDVVITADDVDRHKPDPQPFALAAARMGVSPANCLAVENAPLGIQSAKAAGSPVIAVCTTLGAGDLKAADWIVASHAALENLLALQSAAQFPQDGLSGEENPQQW